MQKYDIICISETFLDSLANGSSLLIPGYHLLRTDHSNNLKKGSVCLYFKDDLSLRRIETSYFSQCMLCELTIQNKVGYIVVIYHSPSQSATEFDNFLTNFEKLLNHVRQLKSKFLLILSDFNAISKSWWCEDITSHKGPLIESLTISYGLQQLIFDARHLLPNSSSCIDLIFTDQPNLIVDSGIHPSLHPKCHYQISYCRCNLTVEYPPPMKDLSGIIKKLT